MKVRFDDAKTAIITWKLQNYENCKDKELVFSLFGDKTVMQMAKGTEIRIPFLTPGSTYTVYAFPNQVDIETTVHTSIAFNIKVRKLPKYHCFNMYSPFRVYVTFTKYMSYDSMFDDLTGQNHKVIVDKSYTSIL